MKLKKNANSVFLDKNTQTEAIDNEIEEFKSLI